MERKFLPRNNIHKSEISKYYGSDHGERIIGLKFFDL